MYIGIPNPNVVFPLEKMVIENEDAGEEITVLYNPQSYVQSNSVYYSQKHVGGNAPIVQYKTGLGENLVFDLFFDSLYAGSEAGGGWDKLKFAANSILPSIANMIDIREYTEKIYNLTRIDPSVHRPPRLNVMWSTLQFGCFLVQCSQRFVKFNEMGIPVRAIVKCVFMRDLDTEELFNFPNESPDTTKFHRVKDGESLWSLSIAEYGQASDWRSIADANGIANPRLLHSGDMLRVPALIR